MGIRVECPNGHVFKVKDKYAGKKGLCPHCEGQVIVQVPDALTANQASDILQREAIQRRQGVHHQAAEHEGSSGSHVFDDPNEGVAPPSSGTSGSLLGLQRDPAQHQVPVRPACADVVCSLPGMRAVFGSLSGRSWMLDVRCWMLDNCRRATTIETAGTRMIAHGLEAGLSKE